VDAVEVFEGRRSGACDLGTWCRIFSEGQAESSGGAAAPGAPDERLRGETGGGVRRWAVRRAGRICGVAGVRPQPVTVNGENAQMLAVNRAVGYRLVRERLLVEGPAGGIAQGGRW
jgi:hypothetical protein